MIGKLFAMFVFVCFLAAPGLSFAKGDKWVVIQDKTGKCSVKNVKGETPKTIAGPFATKEEAERAKAEKCPAKKKTKE
jgi:hypothetical protein